MKKIAFSMLFGMVLSLTAGSAFAITLSFDPMDQVVDIGTPVDIALTISGLGDLTAPSLSTFDLDVNFDPGILSFSSAAYGDPVLGDQLDLLGLGVPSTSTTSVAGSVNLFELSLNTVSELDGFQAGSFTLATLTFNTLALGTSPLGLSINALGDALGDPLAASVVGGSVSVQRAAVPEPSTMLLLGSGLAGLAAWRRRQTVKE